MSGNYAKRCFPSSFSKSFNMRRGLYLILISIFLFPACCFSQLLKGRVLGENGKAAAGVTVRFKDKINATVTNLDGRFSIMATKLPDVLVFSAAGFEPYNVAVTEKNITDSSFEVVL